MYVCAVWGVAVSLSQHDVLSARHDTGKSFPVQGVTTNTVNFQYTYFVILFTKLLLIK